jgi:hypothetical protein
MTRASYGGYGSIQRPPRRRSALPGCACGCFAALGGLMIALVVGVIALLPSLPNVIAQSAGLEPRGAVADVFDAPSILAQIPAIVPAAVSEIFVSVPRIGSQTVSLAAVQNSAQQVNFGTDASSSAPAAVITFSESDLQALCDQRPECSADSRFSNPTIDLQPNGAIVYADVVIPSVGISQRIGAVLRVNSFGSGFEIMGVTINGTLYAIPPDTFGIDLDSLEQQANDALTQVTISAAGYTYAVRQISIAEDMLTVTLG